MSPRIAAGLAWLPLILCACSVEPEVFAPPRQRKALEHATFPSTLITLNDATADLHIVKDIIGPPGQGWRWTGRQPTIRLHVPDNAGFSYQIKFTVADATFKTTGPVTVTFLVNGKTLGTLVCDKPGDRIWKAPVPPEMLNRAVDNTLGAEIDKLWTSPNDGTKLGIILTSIGLVR